MSEQAEQDKWDCYGAILRIRCTRCGDDLELERVPVQCSCGRDWFWDYTVTAEEASGE